MPYNPLGNNEKLLALMKDLIYPGVLGGALVLVLIRFADFLDGRTKDMFPVWYGLVFLILFTANFIWKYTIKEQAIINNETLKYNIFAFALNLIEVGAMFWIYYNLGLFSDPLAKINHDAIFISLLGLFLIWSVGDVVIAFTNANTRISEAPTLKGKKCNLALKEIKKGGHVIILRIIGAAYIILAFNYDWYRVMYPIFMGLLVIDNISRYFGDGLSKLATRKLFQ